MKKIHLQSSIVLFSLVALTALAGLLSSCCSPQPGAVGSDTEPGALATIMSRTSVRRYTDRAVEADKVERLLRAGMAAPTAMNAQPWHFVVVDSAALLGQLADATPHARMLREAPLAIIVCGNMTKTREGVRRGFWIQDCSAAAENILLAAHALGLGAVWTSVYPIEERVQAVSQTLHLPAHIVPLATIVVGYPAEAPEPKDKWNPAGVSRNGYTAAD